MFKLIFNVVYHYAAYQKMYRTMYGQWGPSIEVFCIFCMYHVHQYCAILVTAIISGFWIQYLGTMDSGWFHFTFVKINLFLLK